MVIIKSRLTHSGFYYCFFIYLFFFNLIFSIIVFKFFITYPPNACTQGGLGTPDMSRIVRTFSVAGDTAPNSKCLEQRSPIKSSFRHGLTLGTQTRSSELLPIIPICFPPG